jgi:hypothetical protein
VHALKCAMFEHRSSALRKCEGLSSSAERHIRFGNKRAKEASLFLRRFCVNWFREHLTFFLTGETLMSTVVDMKQMYSTAQIADAIGVSKKTLLRWLWSGKLAEPKQTVGTLDSRVWTQADLNRAKLYREQNYRKRS